MRARAIALFSGGLDSILAVQVVREQNIDVLGITFITPFFGARKAQAAAKAICLDHLVIDITDEHLAMLRSPRYGFGRNMNPCIDCHTLMLRTAGIKMKEIGADFLFTGEVLGQRPMSQTRQSLHIVAKNSGFGDYVLRPLSARLLPETFPEREGMIDRNRLLDIRGRGRKRQMEMARYYGISGYSNPAGGCLLTDPMFSRRLRDLFEHSPDFGKRDIELLKVGRHLRIDGKTKIIVGKNRRDNSAIQDLIEKGDVILNARDFPGPLVLIPHGCDQASIDTAAAVCAHYCDAPDEMEATVQFKTESESGVIKVKAAEREKIEGFMI
ncbi:MAG: tRNA 4-thiouridine(8) synthase ThiI [Syntrophales bacterium]